MAKHGIPHNARPRSPAEAVMKKLLIASAKGGSGKTTIARNICALAAGNGVGIAAIDTDDQFTLSKWWEKREERHDNGLPKVALYQAPMNNVATGLDDLDHDLVIIDTPPVVDKDGSLAGLVELVDYILIPARPTEDDWNSILVVHEIASRAKVPFGYVINQATSRTTLIEMCKKVLLERGGVVCPIIIHNRQDFPIAGMGGFGVTEVKGMKQSSEEIQGVYAFLRQQLGGF